VANGMANGVTNHLSGLHQSDKKLDSMVIKMMASFGWVSMTLRRFMVSGLSTSTWMMPFLQIKTLMSTFTVSRNGTKNKIIQTL